VMLESRKGNRDSRIDFEREINILGENLMNGRLIISESMRGVKDLKNVRYSSNKRVNLDTITEMVRTMAMSVNFNKDKFIPKDKDE
ncbi:MAG: hypothetical protein ACK4IX_00990, partial [Candidatus Sericytochromatia bacterium]